MAGETNESRNLITINRKITLDFRLSEAFKTLRTNIDFCGDDVKTIAFTSCVPGEGKSSVSFNLAISMIEAGKRVLFIDADMRKSVLNGRYQMSKAAGGLAYFLAGRKPLEECIFKTNIPRLFLIPTGAVPPNPAELLGVKRFRTALETLRGQFDYIIIDTPPLGSVIDSAIVEPSAAILPKELWSSSRKQTATYSESYSTRLRSAASITVNIMASTTVNITGVITGNNHVQTIPAGMDKTS